MKNKGNMLCDPRGLIFESYRIDAIKFEDCRAIFFDWALGVPEGEDMMAHIKGLLDEYGHNKKHPMTRVLEEGLVNTPQNKKRRGGRLGRLNNS